jgi:hypothetical protein
MLSWRVFSLVAKESCDAVGEGCRESDEPEAGWEAYARIVVGDFTIGEGSGGLCG